MGWDWVTALNPSKVWNWRDGGGRDRRMLSNPLREAAMLRVRAVVLASALILAPFGAWAADLVVWWDKGFYPQEDEAVQRDRRRVRAEDRQAGRARPLSGDALAGKLEAAIEAGRPPDFAFGVTLQDQIGQWAVDDRLVDLSDAVGAFSNLFDPDALAWVTWRDAQTGRKALYGLPFGREINHVHVWTSLLKAAGFTRRRHPA